MLASGESEQPSGAGPFSPSASEQASSLACVPLSHTSCKHGDTSRSSRSVRKQLSTPASTRHMLMPPCSPLRRLHPARLQPTPTTSSPALMPSRSSCRACQKSSAAPQSSAGSSRARPTPPTPWPLSRPSPTTATLPVRALLQPYRLRNNPPLTQPRPAAPVPAQQRSPRTSARRATTCSSGASSATPSASTRAPWTRSARTSRSRSAAPCGATARRPTSSWVRRAVSSLCLCRAGVLTREGHGLDPQATTARPCATARRSSGRQTGRTLTRRRTRRTARR